jgi:ATP-binding cassette subfamily B (MDR/TAP) protein 1
MFNSGQKQRIAISRALIKNPKILLLDEATSALDSESERIVQRSIDQLLENGKYTTIVVAHRLSTIRNADNIVVVDGGKVVETGTHAELIEMGGQYCNLARAQSSPHKEAGETSSATPDPEVAKSASRSPSSTNLDDADAEEEAGAKEEGAILMYRDVYFSYPTRADTTVFRGLNLHVHAGETLAIVGPSGHGKSTIIQLTERFYDTTKGTIEFDGVDLRSLNVQWLRQQIGLVSQEPILFDTTIAENIRFGLDNVTREEMEVVAKEANAHDFIMSFPDGYDTQVGEAGTQVRFL